MRTGRQSYYSRPPPSPRRVLRPNGAPREAQRGWWGAEGRGGGVSIKPLMAQLRPQRGPRLQRGSSEAPAIIRPWTRVPGRWWRAVPWRCGAGPTSCAGPAQHSSAEYRRPRRHRPLPSPLPPAAMAHRGHARERGGRREGPRGSPDHGRPNHPPPTSIPATQWATAAPPPTPAPNTHCQGPEQQTSAVTGHPSPLQITSHRFSDSLPRVSKGQCNVVSTEERSSLVGTMSDTVPQKLSLRSPQARSGA